MKHERNHESGVILIMVAVTIVVLVGMAAFSVDHGQAWYARTQAQTAADAGAIAGAISRSLDEPVTAGAVTVAAATTAANLNPILGTAGVPLVDTSPGACPPYSPVAFGPCVKVDVYRDG